MEEDSYSRSESVFLATNTEASGSEETIKMESTAASCNYGYCNGDGGSDDENFDSSDDEAIIRRMKLVAQKKRKTTSGAEESALATASNKGAEEIQDSDKISHNAEGNNKACRFPHENSACVVKSAAERHTRIKTISNKGADEIQHSDNISSPNEASIGFGSAKRKKKGTACNSSRWMEMYQRLVKYGMDHGDTKVPRNYNLDPQLAAWVNTQRVQFNKSELSLERTALLNSINFDWVAPKGRPRGQLKGLPSEDHWNIMYERLVAYKKDHGDTKVLKRYKKDPQLAQWVSCQRRAYKNKTMLDEHVSLLNSIDFLWEVHSRSNGFWDDMYQRLFKYGVDHGNTDVPSSYNKKDPQLVSWVNNQRTAYKKGKMSSERKLLLNSIGFDWKEPRSRCSREKGW